MLALKTKRDHYELLETHATLRKEAQKSKFYVNTKLPSATGHFAKRESD